MLENHLPVFWLTRHRVIPVSQRRRDLASHRNAVIAVIAVIVMDRTTKSTIAVCSTTISIAILN